MWSFSCILANIMKLIFFQEWLQSPALFCLSMRHVLWDHLSQDIFPLTAQEVEHPPLEAAKVLHTLGGDHCGTNLLVWGQNWHGSCAKSLRGGRGGDPIEPGGSREGLYGCHGSSCSGGSKSGYVGGHGHVTTVAQTSKEARVALNGMLMAYGGHTIGYGGLHGRLYQDTNLECSLWTPQ